MKIANVISKNVMSDIPDYINNIDSYNDRIIGLPTLVIGWKFTKEMLGDKYALDILNYKIDESTYWTFSKFEKRDDYEEEIEKFYNLSIIELEKTVKYSFFSLITNDLSRIKRFIKFIDSAKSKIIYVYNKRMVYIYNDKHIYGLSLDEVEFIGIDKDKAIKRLYKNSEFNHNCDITDVLLENGDLVEKLKNNIKLIPLIYCG